MLALVTTMESISLAVESAEGHPCHSSQPANYDTPPRMTPIARSMLASVLCSELCSFRGLLVLGLCSTAFLRCAPHPSHPSHSKVPDPALYGPAGSFGTAAAAAAADLMDRLDPTRGAEWHARGWDCDELAGLLDRWAAAPTPRPLLRARGCGKRRDIYRSAVGGRRRSIFPNHISLVDAGLRSQYCSSA